jgi:glycosyltransferase involved in cell wall biosynthesis
MDRKDRQNGRPTVSYVICTYRRPEALQACVESILGQTRLPEEIVVVDASETPEGREPVQKLIEGTGVRLVYVQDAPSIPGQRNTGVRTASGDLIFYIDDDATLDPSYTEKILETFELKSGENVAGVRGQLANLSPPSRGVVTFLRRAIARIFFTTELREDGIARMKRSGFPLHVHRPPGLERCEIMFAICAYRRNVLQEFKSDETFGGYVHAEDMDLSHRISRKYPLYINPEAKCYHYPSPYTVPKQIESRKRTIFFTHYFFKKNIPQTPLNRLIRCWSLVGYFLDVLVVALRVKKPNYVRGYFAGILCILKGSPD